LKKKYKIKIKNLNKKKKKKKKKKNFQPRLEKNLVLSKLVFSG